MRDPFRPTLHLTLDNWINDPIPFYWKGQYHLYLQHNPKAPWWGDMHWAHAASTDLVRWEVLPIALAPDRPYDERGVWTGSVIEHDGRFYAFYTSIPTFEPFTQWQSFAVSEDLVQWTKHPCSPVLTNPPEGFGPCWRDPQVWREGKNWKMIVGSQREGVGGAALLYESYDLRNWSYLGVLAESPTEQTGFDYECPDFFELDGKWVLLTSREAVHWQTGTYDGRSFVASSHGVCDGPDYTPDTKDASPFYAAKTLLDGKGRRLQFGWLRERRSEEEQKANGWSGAQSFPRVCQIVDDRLAFAWPEELLALRQTEISPEEACRLDPELPVEIEVKGGRVAFEENGQETVLAETGSLRLFSDGSVIEAIVDGHPTTLRSYTAERKLTIAGGQTKAWRLSQIPLLEERAG